MNILLKNTLRSVDSNKGQVLVIVVTIMVVTAMIFVALSMFDVFYNINMAEANRVAQDSHMLLGRNHATNEFFSEARVRSFVDENDISTSFYFTKFNTILKTETESITVLLEATDLEYYFSKRPLNYTQVFNADTEDPDIRYEFIGGYSTIIIGESFAKKHEISVGDLVEIYIPTYNRYTKVVVEYIAKNEAIFSSPADKNILVDFSSIGNNGQVNAVYFNFNSPELFEKYETIFEENFPAVKVGEGNNKEHVLQIVKNNTTLLTVGLVFLVATLMLILYTSYIIIARNRASEMIIFKATGATPFQTSIIMLLEVLFYAIVGGGVGLLLGRAAMGLAAKMLIPLVHTALNYAWWKYILSFLISVIVSVLSTIAPIISTSKKTIRELTSQSEKIVKKPKGLWVIILSVLLVGLGITYSFLRGTALLIVAPMLIVVMVLWVVVILPYTIQFFSAITGKIAQSGSGKLASISLLRNKAINTVAMLVAIVTVFSFLVFQVVSLVNTAVIPFRTRYDADFVISSTSEDIEMSYLEAKDKIDDIDTLDFVGYFNSVNFVVPGTEDKEWSLYGVDTFETLVHCTSGLEDVTKECWDSMDNCVVLSRDMYIRFGVKIGDEIKISPIKPDFSDEIFVLKVVGIDDTVTEYDRIGYCKFSYIKDITSGATFLITAKPGVDKQMTFIELRRVVEEFERKEFYALTYAEWATGSADNLAGIGTLLEILQVAVYIVGIMGVLNISIVTAIDRRDEMKLYKIGGMSGSDYLRFSLFEGLNVALSGGLIGFIMSWFVNLIMPTFSSLIDRFTAVKFFPLSLPIIFASSVLLFTFIWVVIASVEKRKIKMTFNERVLL
ncbi:MAG TPA: hypothetical protein PKX91_02930 [Clostridia bacterium]|nr:hypothetical protein [Clostridia bacterium]